MGLITSAVCDPCWSHLLKGQNDKRLFCFDLGERLALSISLSLSLPLSLPFPFTFFSCQAHSPFSSYYPFHWMFFSIFNSTLIFFSLCPSPTFSLPSFYLILSLSLSLLTLQVISCSFSFFSSYWLNRNIKLNIKTSVIWLKSQIDNLTQLIFYLHSYNIHSKLTNKKIACPNLQTSFSSIKLNFQMNHFCFLMNLISNSK